MNKITDFTLKMQQKLFVVNFFYNWESRHEVPMMQGRAAYDEIVFVSQNEDIMMVVRCIIIIQLSGDVTT